MTRNDFRSYQNRAVDFIKQHPNCALFVEMGLGKTVCTITAFLDMQADVKHMLVVAPLRVARDVWHAEVEEWAHTRGLTVVKIVGDATERNVAMQTRADIHTINRENLDWLANKIVVKNKQVLKWPWKLVVLDESTSFRSQSAKRWKAVRKLRKLIPRLVLLSGTPIPNGVGGLWAQFYLLDQGQRLGKTETEFKKRWFNPPPFYEFGKWTPKPGAFDEIMAAIADITLTLRAEDYLDLPPVVTNIIKCHFPDGPKQQYRRLERHCILETFTGNKFTASNAGVLAGKLLQLANGAMYTNEQGDWELLHNAKLKLLFELLDEHDGGPVLIAYNFKSDRERIAALMPAFCAERGKRWGVLKTEDSVREWNAGKLDFVLIHPGSAGHGLNLQHSGSETIFWFGNTYDAELHDQLNGRLAGGHRRVGRNIVINYLVTEGTIDEDVVSALGQKKLTQDALMTILSRRAAGSATVPRPQ